MPAQRIGGGEVHGPRPDAPAEDEHALRLARHAERAARADVAIRLDHRARHRPPRDEIPVSLASRDREREAHAARERREHAVCEAEVAVGLG